MKRGSAIYQLGILSTGQQLLTTIREAFVKALNDKIPEVKLAALSGMAWLSGEELLPLVKAARQDPDDSVRRKAELLLEAYAFQKTSDAFLTAMQEENEEVQRSKISEFNTLYDEFLEQFPEANPEAIAREASYQFGISLEEALDDLQWARKYH